MNKFMQTAVSTMKTQQPYRSLVAVLTTACAAVVLSACIGGGGGDSSGDQVDLQAAYEKIEGCMDRNDLIRVVGMAPNDVDASNTMIWESGKYRLMVQLQLWSNGLYIAKDKSLLGPGVDRGTAIDSCEG